MTSEEFAEALMKLITGAQNDGLSYEEIVVELADARAALHEALS